MVCTKNRLKTWVRAVLALCCALLVRPSDLWAAFASQFSLSIGEEYSDNLFFSKEKKSDFVTIITPTLSLYYAPVGQTTPSLNLNISPSGQIYARIVTLTTLDLMITLQ